MKLTVIIPIKNEASVLIEFHSRLNQVLNSMKHQFEIIFVDDGSEDKSYQICRELVSKAPEVSVIKLTRNFGQQPAIKAGLQYAEGDWIITMDGDLQHPPEMIPELLVKALEGYDVVNTQRLRTQGTSIFKRFTSCFFYFSFNLFTNLKLEYGLGEFRIISRKVCLELRSLPEYSRFHRALIKWLGFKQTIITFNSPARFSGNSSIKFRHMLEDAVSSITSFSSSPLRLILVTGMGIMGLAIIATFYIIYAYYQHQTVPGWPSTAIAILLIGGLQLVAMGLIGEYIARIFDESKKRPSYIIEEKIGNRFEPK